MTGAIAAPPVVLDAGARRARRQQSGLIVAGLSFLALTNPDRPLPFDICIWHRLTGYRCLTCGLTRSVCHAIRGDWAGSVADHPAGIVVLALLAAWAIRSTLEASSGRALRFSA